MKSDLFEAQMTNPEDIRRFIFAGRALFTVVSKKTGQRFTYKIRQPQGKDKNIMFVSVLNGPDNENSYLYLGYLLSNYRSGLNAGNKGRPDSVSYKALNWIIRHLDKEDVLDQIEFYHAGKCGACGRTLTVPESIETGLGPVCAGRQ